MRSSKYIAIFIPLAVIALVITGLGVFDFTRKDKVAEGVTVNGVDVGGMNRDEAKAKLRAELLPQLERPVEIQMKGRTFRLGPRESRVAADLESTVDAAIAAGRKQFFVVRSASTIAGVKTHEDVSADVIYSDAAVKRVVRRVLKGTEDKPVDAHIEFTEDKGFKLVDAQDGVTIDTGKLEAEIRTALAAPGSARRFEPDAEYDPAKVHLDDLAKKYPTLLVVDRGDFKLTLYKNLKVAKTYGVAVGAAGLETPAGRYTIASKAENPAWHVPNSDWAGKLKGKVIPAGDPRNPIAARWLGIYDGVGIHGTYDPGSIGSNASHGCIRMKIPDVEALYPEVPVGTAVYIS